MKKLVCILFLLFTPLYILAENTYVIDEANLLNDKEEENLNSKLSSLSKKYNSDFVVLIVESCDGQAIEAFADDYFDYHGYGQGINRNGVIIVTDMEQGEVAISTSGNGIDAFTDYGIDLALEEIVTYLSEANYYKAYDRFGDIADDYYRLYKQGTPVDEKKEEKSFKPFNLTALGGSGLIAGLMSVLQADNKKRKLNTNVKEKDADNYIYADEINLRDSQDIYLKTIVEEKERSSSNKGSTTHSSKSGNKHGGASKKF